MRRWSFTKGHGTENDFVVILDRESMLDVGPAEVRFICNRRAGVGADGLLRAVLAKHVEAGMATVLCGSWTTATLMDPSRRCAATESESSCATCSIKTWSVGRSSKSPRAERPEGGDSPAGWQDPGNHGPWSVGSRSVVVTPTVSISER